MEAGVLLYSIQRYDQQQIESGIFGNESGTSRYTYVQYIQYICTSPALCPIIKTQRWIGRARHSRPWTIRSIGSDDPD